MVIKPGLDPPWRTGHVQPDHSHYPHEQKSVWLGVRILASLSLFADIPGPPPPPPHHPNQRLPPPGMGAEHPPWGGGQHPDFAAPPPGFNGHSPHVRQRHHPVQEDPCLVPNVPYFDLPAGLMAPLVKVSPVMWFQSDPAVCCVSSVEMLI